MANTEFNSLVGNKILMTRQIVDAMTLKFHTKMDGLLTEYGLHAKFNAYEMAESSYHSLICELEAYIAGREHSEVTGTMLVPNDWWSYFLEVELRQRPWLAWLLRRLRIRTHPNYRTINIQTTHTMLCPHLKVNPDQKHIEFITSQFVPSKK